MTASKISERVRRHLARVYPDLDASELDALATRILHATGVSADATSTDESSLPGPDEVMLITYGSTFSSPGRTDLASLQSIWQDHFDAIFSTVHVLPFFPSSSDGGFAVVDYRSVDPAIGDWHGLRDLVGDGELMVDLVCNHGSAQSEWFTQFRNNEEPGRTYYLTVDPSADLSQVTRPRTHPLLAPIETPTGTRHVWATFSHDQVDFDFGNPDVLVEFCSILGFYLAQGATRVRLDAIAYLWKRLGTNCIHLAETHEIVKLMRLLLDAHTPGALMITETNVPHSDNVSYFGDGDEAHVVYNFTLAPLIVWSMIAGRGVELTNWLGRLQPPATGCAFLNFIASHDGLGLRPVEDLVSLDELQPMIDAAAAVGGACSMYSAPGGPRPYELNVSLADLLAGADGAFADRFVAAHALMLAVQGIPALYVHSLLASPGDIDAVARSGHKRDINRSRVNTDHAVAQLTTGWQGACFDKLSALLKVRRSQPAFAPASEQVIHVLHDQVVAIERRSSDQTILALHNVSGEPVSVIVPSDFGRYDLLADQAVPTEFTLAPWQAAWLT